MRTNIHYCMNVPNKVLNKCSYFVANQSSKMAARGELSLTKGPYTILPVHNEMLTRYLPIFVTL